VLSIAGFDPCGGAGVLADIKTMEAHKVNGLAVATSITYQNENTIRGIQWLETQEIIHQINPLLEKYDLNVVKIGLIKNLEHLKEIVKYLKEKKSTIKIIWDPILKSSSGFTFHESMNKEEVFELCRDIFLITPNIFEACIAGSNDPYKSSQILSCYTNVYLKGGHNETEKGRDYLFIKNNLPDNKNVKNFRPKGKNLKEKHGSGCVLSSAIAANIAKGYPLLRACLMAKQYVQYFLNSNDGLLGYHKI
jgi:hydroxymethylpyrimidine/phosphomethylpyrimidine kinase